MNQSSESALYEHTQRAPLCLLIYLTAGIFAGVAWFVQNAPVVAIAHCFGAVLMTVLAACFHFLRVADEGDRLSVAFGPVPLFRRTVPYADIEIVEVGRTTLLDGWGIHRSLRGGSVWNIWGRDCVVIRLQKGILRIGTDDTEGLAQFLRKRLAESGE